MLTNRSMMFSDIHNRDLGTEQQLESLDTGAHTTWVTEKATDEEDTKRECPKLPADVAAVFPTGQGYHHMKRESPTNVVIEENVLVADTLDNGVVATETNELGETNDEDTLVLLGALPHVEHVPPTGHHLAHTNSSALTATKAPTSNPARPAPRRFL